MYHIGIDLGGTKIEGVAMTPGFEGEANPENAILHRERIPTEAKGGYSVILDRVVQLIQMLIDKTGTETGSGKEKLAVGIGLPGSVSRRTGYIKNSNTTCLIGKNLREDVQSKLGLPIEFENDANCFALAETQWGGGKGGKLVFGVIMGTGVGGGLIYDGKILAGRQNIGGEWGHSILFPGGYPCYCGKKGCVETYLCGPAFRKHILEPNGFNMTAEEFNKFYKEEKYDDQAAVDKVIAEYCDLFGMALSNLINILDPDIIVLGGGMSNLSFLYDSGVKAVEKYVFNDELLSEIVPAKLGDSAGVFGAALLGMNTMSAKVTR